MKRPSFQFYVKDWRTNLKLRRCSEAARGAWIDVLCVLHDSEEYGVARFPLEELAEAAGVKSKSIRELVSKGVLKGSDAKFPGYFYTPRHAGKAYPQVTLLTPSESPLWFSSRMVRDEWARSRRGESTRFSTDYQPPPTGRVGDPLGDEPTRPPTGTPGVRQGDGAAFASAVELSSSVVAVTTVAPRPSEAAEDPNPPPTPDSARITAIVRLCKAAKVESAPDNDPFIAKWISQFGASNQQIEKALAEARAPFRKPHPQILPLSYVDKVLGDIVAEDGRARDLAERRVQDTQRLLEEQRLAAGHAVPKPEGFPDLARRPAP